jgi:hypothetical protein
MKIPAVALLSLAMLAACGGPPRVPEDHDHLQRAIQAPQDRARAVEEQLKADEQRKRKAIEAAGGDSG